MKNKLDRATKLAATASPDVPQALLADLRALIRQARTATVRAIDEQLSALSWRVGTRIHQEILKLV